MSEHVVPDLLLSSVVGVAEAVAETSKRSEKVARLAELFRGIDPGDAPAVIGLLLGSPRQGRVGVGWATLAAATATATAATKPPESSVTIHDVDAMFDLLAATSGDGSQAERHALVGAVFSRASTAEQQFLRRVFSGEMRQGANAGVITDAVARAAERPLDEVRRAAMLIGDLGRVAQLALADADLTAVGLSPLVGVQPMLASTAANVTAALTAIGAASVEYKLDGARVQVHRRGDEVRVFTRTLHEISARVPVVVAAALSIPGVEFVLDGEALGLDLDGNPLAFQDSMSGSSQLRPYFFDVLYDDGESLIDEPLSVRKARLRRLVPIELLLPTIDVDAAAEPDDVSRAVDFAAAAIADGHEGVMIKAHDSPYQAGRRGKTWLKVKPVHTFDLVVLAVEWGHGRRTGLLSNLHLGARSSDGEFVMVGKTFKGLTDALLRWQTDTFPAIATHTAGHIVHVRPEVVVEIAIDGVQRSTRYPGGVALRFARVKRYRDDKRPDEADSIETLQAML